MMIDKENNSRESLKKICYISYETFYHADKSLLPLLSSEYNLSYYLIEPIDSIISQSDLSSFAQKSGFAVQCFKHLSRRRSIKQLYYYLRLFLRVVALKPDIVFVVAEYNIYFALLAPIFLNRRETIVAFHDVVPHNNETNFLKDLSLEILKWNFKRFHFFSKSQMNTFISKYKNKHCTFAPLLLSDYGALPLGYDTKSNDLNFLFFGAVKYYKGLDILLKAVEELSNQGITNFKVTIAGNGKYWESCNALINNYELYNLVIRFIEDEEIPVLFSQASYLVLPYRDVTQSGPLAISHYYNIPAIASNHKGFSEHIVPFYNGYLFNNEDVDDLKSVLLHCIHQSKDEYQQVKENLNSYTTALYSSEKILAAYKGAFERYDIY